MTEAQRLSVVANAIADQAQRWWNEYDVTPYRLAQALAAGQPPTANRRQAT